MLPFDQCVYYAFYIVLHAEHISVGYCLLQHVMIILLQLTVKSYPP